MDICEKYLQDAHRALKSSMFSKPDPVEAIRSYEGAAQCFENYQKYDRAAECYIDTADLVIRSDPLKAAEMIEKAALCMRKVGESPKEFYLRAATIYKDHAVQKYRENPDQGLQLLQRAAENFERGGDTKTSIQCYEVGAEASLKREDYLNAIVFYGIAGQNFERRKQYKKAVKYYHEVAKLWDLQKVPKNVAENYLRMASCLRLLEEFKYSSQFAIKAGEKYEEGREVYKAAKSYEKASETFEAMEDFIKAAQYYTKGAELIKTLKNLDKYEELYSKAAECYLKAGKVKKSIKIRLELAEVFTDNAYRCNQHFEKAIASVEDNLQLKADLLKKQGEVLQEIHEYLGSAKSYQQAAELMEELGEPFSDLYKKAGNAYSSFAKSMAKVRNHKKAREGNEYAVACFEKAGLGEEAAKIRQVVKPDTGEREKQIRAELNRLKNDFENGLVTNLHYQQMKEGYDEILNRLSQ
jgi:tetratricopeptide (TPR) repeat protein